MRKNHRIVTMPIDQIRTFIREAHNENEMIEVILFNSCHKKYYFILDTTFDSFIVSTLLRSNFITINFYQLILNFISNWQKF